MKTIFKATGIVSFGGTSPLSLLLSSLIALGSLIQGAIAGQSPFTLLHAFSGAANDGGSPWWDSSLASDGSTLYGMTANGGVSTNGVIFKVSTGGCDYEVLHNFDGYFSFFNPDGSKDDGAVPYGTPVLSGSTLYGMTASGGSNGFGTVWSMNISGTGFQILHHFGGTLDGYGPNGSLVLDGSTLYGMTQNGGSNSAIGVIFKIETNGTGYQILRHFDVSNNGASTPYGTPIVSGGRLYGTTRLGGSGSNGAIWAMDTDGSDYQVIHNFTGTSTDGSHPYGTLVLDGTTLHGTTTDGGANNAGVVYEIQTSGAGFQINHDFASTEAFNPYGGLIRDGTTLYGFTKSGVTNGLGGGAIFQINTDGSDYRRLYTFRFPVVSPDGQWPYGLPLKIGTKLFGMTQLGGVFLGNSQGTVFSFDLTGSGGNSGGCGGGGGTPSLSGTLSKVKDKCKTKNLVTTCKLGAGLAVLNSGDGEAPATHIRFFLSTDANYDDGVDTLLGEATTKTIKPGKAGKGKLKAETAASSAGQFILAVDDDDAVLASFQVPAI